MKGEIKSKPCLISKVFPCHASQNVFPKPTTLNEKLKYFYQTQQMQIKLKSKWKVKRFFLLLTCQAFKVQGSVFLFQHLAAETPRVEWRDFLLTLALFIISEVSTNVFNTTQRTQTESPCSNQFTV